MLFTKSRLQAVFILFYILIVGAIILPAQDSTMREVGRRDAASALPDGEGKALVLGTCTQCHSLNSTVLQRKSNAEWERTVRDMVARGAQIHANETGIIAAYLARSFGPGAPPIGASNEKASVARPASSSPSGSNNPDSLPEGSAKALILRSCTSCHVLGTTTDARKSEAGWRASVKDMIRLGAKLNAEEESSVIAYLAKHFNRQSLPAGVAATAASRQTQGASTGDMAMGSNPVNSAQSLPDDEGKGLILSACAQCHTLRYTLEMRKDAENWRRTVDDMVARGTQLTSAEADIVARYLAKHRAKESNGK